MGVKSFILELKLKVSASRLFKALVTESHHVLPKAIPSISTIDLVEGHGITPGCILQTNFHDGAGQLKYLKNRFEVVDEVGLVGKFTLVEGDALGEKLEKICYELRFEEASEDGGCVLKLLNEYHGKGDYEVSDEDIEAGKGQAAWLYRACEQYLLANPADA